MDLLITTATMASNSHVMVFNCRSPLGNLGQRWLGDDDVFVIDGGLEVWRSGFNKAFRFQLSRKPFLKDALPQWLH
jgi:hypothetical protein